MLVEQGTHAELMAVRGLYRELFEIQAGAYRAAAGRVDGG
jgi:ABC-type multidrug transport system fused ATPase/permease subunit